MAGVGCTPTLDVGTPHPELQGCCDEFTVGVRFNEFASLPLVKGAFIESPDIHCFGHEWKIRLYPGGHDQSKHGMVGLAIRNCSLEKIEICFQLSRGVDKIMAFESEINGFDGFVKEDAISHSKVIAGLDNGSFVVKARMRLRGSSLTFTLDFVPLNSPIDEKYADILFDVRNDKLEGLYVQNMESTFFRAHRFVLQARAPMLADICEWYHEKTPVPICDVHPSIFSCVLKYLYGSSISRKDLETNAKDIIDAADKFGVIGMKLMVQGVLAKSSTINLVDITPRRFDRFSTIKRAGNGFHKNRNARSSDFSESVL